MGLHTCASTRPWQRLTVCRRRRVFCRRLVVVVVVVVLLLLLQESARLHSLCTRVRTWLSTGAIGANGRLPLVAGTARVVSVYSELRSNCSCRQQPGPACHAGAGVTCWKTASLPSPRSETHRLTAGAAPGGERAGAWRSTPTGQRRLWWW
jgi:hypothetical protein